MRDERADVVVSLAGDTTFAELAAAFLTWPKPAETFERYARRRDGGEVAVLVARVDGDLAGYCLVEWASTYPPFAAVGIPEIVDLNVLADHRGRGAGRELLEAAEQLAGTRSDVIGLRVGLYADYGRAQRLYARKGYVPDGAGVTIDGVAVPPGAWVALDDDPVLALTRHLRTPRR